MRRVPLDPAARVLAALVLAAVVLNPVLAPADPVGVANTGVTVTDHRAAYVVDAGGTLRAAETLTVTFAEPRAGLERRFDLRDPGAVRGVREPRGVSVTRDGQAEEVRLERAAGVVVARLGDHDRELSGEHVYVLRWSVAGVLGRASTTDGRARLRLDVLPAGWGAPVLRSRSSLGLPGRPARTTCRASGSTCRPRVGAAGVVTVTGRTAPGRTVTVDVLLDAPAAGTTDAAVLPWPLRWVPVLGERWWPPLLVLAAATLAAYAGARVARRPRPRPLRLLVLGAVLVTVVTWLLAPWTLAVLVPGAFAAAAVPVLLPGGARPPREQLVDG